MKFLFLLLAFSISAAAQDLSPEEQKRLIQENEALKAQVKNLESPSVDPAVMQKLMKGQKHIEEQNKFLEELDKEE